MSLRMTVATLALLLLCAAPLLAAETAAAPVLSLEERLQDLEARQTELYHTLAEKKSAGLSEAISKNMTLSGLVEVEANASRVSLADQSTISSSALTLATAQLGLDARVNEEVGVNLTLLYEEGGELEVDEAFIHFEAGRWSLNAGRLYLPFGAFHSHFVSDPLTLTLGETRQTAILAGYSQGAVQLQAFAFNGNEDKIGREDHINDGGLRLTVTPYEGLEFGASVLSDLAESGAELLGNGYTRRVAGWSAYAHLQQGRLGLEAEYLAAVRAFAAGDLDANGDGSGDRPQTWNLEVAYSAADNVKLALRYEGSKEFVAQPEQQYGAVVAYSPWEKTTLALEYLRGNFDRGFGSDVDKSDLVTAQLAIEF